MILYILRYTFVFPNALHSMLFNIIYNYMSEDKGGDDLMRVAVADILLV